MADSRKFTALLLAGALASGLAAPAYAGKSDRAAQAIAAAQAKIDSARTVGAGTELPRRIAAAQAELARASEAKQSGHNEDAIQIAIHAQAMADAILGETTQRKEDAAAATRAAAQDQAAAAQHQVEAPAPRPRRPMPAPTPRSRQPSRPPPPHRPPLPLLPPPPRPLRPRSKPLSPRLRPPARTAR